MKQRLKNLLLIMIIIFPISIQANECWDYDENKNTLTIHQVDYNLYSDSEKWNKYSNSIKKIIIDDGVDFLYSNMFRDLQNLEEVKLPDSMGAYIDDYAFYNCPKLKEIKLPIGITRVGKYAFYGTGIKKVNIPIYLNWIEENAFNENTEIIKLAEKEHIIDAGTAGPTKEMLNSFSEGRARDNTCYNKYYYGLYWDDTAYWKLYEDGTLVVTGTEMTVGYLGSRIPWGCYKNKIKRIIYNEDYIGTLTKRNKNNLKEALPNATYAIYVNKPIEEIMNNRLKVITAAQLWDCREDCINGFRNLEEIIVNRGVEEIKAKAFKAESIKGSPSNTYISKYVKKIGDEQLIYTQTNEDSGKTINLEVSYEEYKNNNYDYGELVDENGFKTTIKTSVYHKDKKSFINNKIDDYYVSINNDLAPKTIKVDGKTLYLYETYITKENGSVDVSIPKDDGLEYYVKEIKAPKGFDIDKVAYRIDTSKDKLNIEVADYPLKRKSSKSITTIINPETKTPIIVILLIIISLSTTIILRKKQEQ